MAIIPNSKPALERKKADAILRKNGVTDAVALIGIRGYFLDTMGVAGENDIGIYDDAIILASPYFYGTYNANTDPSRHRAGIATLLPGLHLYKKGKHGISRPGGGYPALRPANACEALPVSRVGEGAGRSKRDGVAINIHRGSYNSTSSEGCQTVYPAQWEGFIASVYDQMDRAGQKTIPYLLLNGL